MTEAGRKLAKAVAVATTILFTAAATARAEDAHALFESRCATCHGPHAGAFARESLVLDEHVPRGRESGAPVAGFLLRHAGGQSAETADLLTEMFRLQLSAGGVYERRCRICHDRARDLARHTLILRQDTLAGRYTGRDIHAFLQDHGRLASSEIEPLFDLLKWQLESAEERYEIR